MDGATVFRMISLIPDRTARSQSGSVFDDRSFERAGLLSPFLGWLGPLNPITKEDQHLLGLRTTGSKLPLEGEEPADMVELEEPEVRAPGEGTQIAA
jgi:hypothetical protein